MSFKLKSPYKINPVSVHQVPFSPDNIGESNGLVAKANDNGTIIMNKNIPQDSKLYNNAMSHEGRHLKDMMDNKLAYDENFVYENMDGKGAKKHSRSSFSEDDKKLSWEAPAYKDGDNGVEHDLRPKPNKLSGIPSMKDETPIAFKVMGSRHKEGRSPDKEKISMNERFAMYAPAKSWGGPANTDPLVSGGEPDASGSPYSGGSVTFSPTTGQLVYTTTKDNNTISKAIKRDDQGKIMFPGYTKGDNKSDKSLQNASSYKNKPADMSDEDYNREFRNQLSRVDREYKDKMANYQYYDDLFTKGGELPTINYGGGNITLKPGQDFNSLGATPMERMMNMKFVYDKPSTTGKGSIGSGDVTLQGLLDDQKAAAAKAGMKGTSGAYSDLKKTILGENTKQRQRNYELTSTELAKAQEAFPDMFKGTNTQDLKRIAAEDKLSKEYFGQGGVGGILSDVGGGQRYRLEQEYRKKLAELKTKKFDI